MFRARGHRIVAIAVAGTLLLSACGGDDSSSSDTTESGGGGTGGEGDGGAFAVNTDDCPDDSATEPIEGTVKIGTTLPLSGGAAAAAFAPVKEGLENYFEYANENELLPGYTIELTVEGRPVQLEPHHPGRRAADRRDRGRPLHRDDRHGQQPGRP